SRSLTVMNCVRRITSPEGCPPRSCVRPQRPKNTSTRRGAELAPSPGGVAGVARKAAAKRGLRVREKMLTQPYGRRSTGAICRLVGEGLLEKCFLLELVDLSHTSCGGGLRATGHALQLDTRQVLRQLQRDERPRTLVGRLVLYPAELGVRVVGQSVADAV